MARRTHSREIRNSRMPAKRAFVLLIGNIPNKRKSIIHGVYQPPGSYLYVLLLNQLPDTDDG